MDNNDGLIKIGAIVLIILLIAFLFFMIIPQSWLDAVFGQTEGFSGALLQLQAQGPEDVYINSDAWQYYPWPMYYDYGKKYTPWYYNPFYYYSRRSYPRFFSTIYPYGY